MPPALLAQTAQPTQLNPSLAGAALWTYGLTYAHGLAEQDDVIVTASFNVAGPVDEAKTGSPPIEVARSSPPLPDGAPTRQSYTCSVRLGYRAGDEATCHLDTLALTAGQAAPSPSDQWPSAFWLGPDGATVPLAAGSPAGGTVIYRFPANSVPTSSWPIITLEWPGLPVAAVQNARGALTVRPAQNPPRAASDGAALATPSVEATSAVAPLNIWPEPFDITGGGTTPVDALQSALQTLFGTLDCELITLAVACACRLTSGAAGDDDVVTTVPVALYPYLVLGPGTTEAIGAAMTEWETNNPLAGTGTEWIFSLTFYSRIGDMSARPLLTLDRLTYRVKPRPSQPPGD